MKHVLLCILLVLITGIFPPGSPAARAQQPPELYEPDTADVARSPKPGWNDFGEIDRRQAPWWARALLWIPNRLLDAIDVFRVDVGVGPAYGGVIRATPYAQLAYRKMDPFSVRVGDFGRQAPAIVETSDEYMLGSRYHESSDRTVCPGEVGIGIDLLAGAYVGVCLDELADFAAGLFFFDLKGDDYQP